MNNVVDKYAQNFGEEYALSLPSLGEAPVEVLKFLVVNACVSSYNIQKQVMLLLLLQEMAPLTFNEMT